MSFAEKKRLTNSALQTFYRHPMKPNQAIVNVEKALEKQDNAARESDSQLLWQIVGGVKVSRSLVENLSAQTMRAMKRIEEDKLYRAAGFPDFASFLASPNSPMTKNQYYDRLKLLENEGSEMFDLLNGIGLANSIRKQLKKAELQIEGDELVIGDDRVALSDTPTLKAVLNDIAHERERTHKKLSKHEAEIKELKTKLVETVKAAKGKSGKEAGTPFGQALLMALVALDELAKEVGELDQDELKLKQDNCLNRLGEKTRQIMEAFKLQTQPLKRKGKKDLPDDLDDELFDDE